MNRTLLCRRIVALTATLILLLLTCSGCGVSKAQQEALLQEQLGQAQDLIGQEKQDEAQALLEQLITDYPQDPRAYGLLSDLHLQENRWQIAQETLEQGIEAASSPSSLEEKLRSLKQKIESQAQAAAVLKPVVTYWEDLYYWKYSSEGVTSQNTIPFYPITSKENQLIRVTPDGEETVLYTGPGGGDLLIFQDQVYFSAGEVGMGIVSIQGGQATFVQNATPAGCDFSQKLVLYSSLNENPPLLTALDEKGTSTPLAEGRLLAVADGRAYYQQTDDMWLQLCSVNLDGSDPKALCQVLLDTGNGERQIQLVQVAEERAYFSYGIYNWDTGVFEDAGIAQVHTDGTGFSNLADDAVSPWFLVYLDNGAPMLRYQSQGEVYPSYEIPTGSASCQSLNIENGTASVSPMPCGPQGVPFSDGQGNLWVYPDLSGTPTQLLSSNEEFLSTGKLPSGIQQDNAAWNSVSQACISGDFLYFTVVQSSYDYAGDSHGGYPCFLRDSSQMMRKSLSTGETELLYLY